MQIENDYSRQELSISISDVNCGDINDIKIPSVAADFSFSVPAGVTDVGGE